MHARQLLPVFVVLVLPGFLAGCGEQETASNNTVTEKPATVPTAPSQTAETQPPAASNKAATDTQPREPQTVGAISRPTSLSPGLYTSGQISLKLSNDGTFQMNQTSGDKGVTGTFTYDAGMLTLANPEGDVGAAQFPMRCRVQAQGTSEFTLAATENSCSILKGLTFRPKA